MGERGKGGKGEGKEGDIHPEESWSGGQRQRMMSRRGLPREGSGRPRQQPGGVSTSHSCCGGRADLEVGQESEAVPHQELYAVCHSIQLSISAGTGHLHWVQVNGHHCTQQ